VVGSEKGGSASLGRGGKKSHRDNSLSARRRQKDGTREGSKRRKRREQTTISQRQGKRMSNAGGGGPRHQQHPYIGSGQAVRLPPYNGHLRRIRLPHNGHLRKSRKVYNGKLTRHKRPHRRTTARFAAQRLLSTRPAATPERARGEVAGPRSKTPMNMASAPADAFGQGVLSSRHAPANHGLKRGELL